MAPEVTARTVAGRIRALPAERPRLTHCTKLLCSAFLTVLLLAGVFLFVAYLAVRPHRPRFHVTAFAAVGIPSGGPVVLSGQLDVRNPNRNIAFFYDRLYMTVQYGGDAVVTDLDLNGGPLYQPPKTSTVVPFQGVVVTAASASVGMARDAAEGGTVAMTVKVRSRIRARLAFWGTRHWHPLHVSCDVAVGPDGQLLPEYQQRRCSIDFF